jgi:2-polyprenyl-6-methoxyphenol hydroxylase-like FAD-dependent oxidoreductase
MQIIVIGGGIGGLACAIGLKNGGHEVTVLEKVPVMAEVWTITSTNRPGNAKKSIGWSGH